MQLELNQCGLDIIQMMEKVMKKKRKLRGKAESFEEAHENSFPENEPSYDNNDLNDTAQPEKLRTNDHGSENKIRPADDETMGESTDDNLPRPYEFLKFANPPLHMIFVPHFQLKSLSFIVSAVFVVAFVVLLAYSYSQKDQSKLTWNCSIFQLQNKYYPRIRYSFQFWRILISGVFHSNIAHFVLNLIGFQIYAYFAEWYYGKLKFGLTLLFSVIFSHLLSCVALPTTVSTVSSSALYSTIALKIYFLFEYRDYKPLLTRRIFIYVLMLLISVVNLIPIFVGNNVDYTAHLGGFICGGLMGLFFHFQREETVEKEELTRLKKALKFGSLVVMVVLMIIFLAVMFGREDENNNFLALNNNIASKCANGER